MRNSIVTWLTFGGCLLSKPYIQSLRKYFSLGYSTSPQSLDSHLEVTTCSAAELSMLYVIHFAGATVFLSFVGHLKDSLCNVRALKIICLITNWYN